MWLLCVAQITQIQLTHSDSLSAQFSNNWRYKLEYDKIVTTAANLTIDKHSLPHCVRPSHFGHAKELLLLNQALNRRSKC